MGDEDDGEDDDDDGELDEYASHIFGLYTANRDVSGTLMMRTQATKFDDRPPSYWQR